jgi:ribose 5-phosphate isomerase B
MAAPTDGRELSKLDEREIAELVRRVAGRVLAERGNARSPHGRPETERAQGVFVTLEGGPHTSRPAESQPGGSSRQRPLVAAEALADVADGAVWRVPAGALVTPAARDEATRRRIRLVEGELSASACDPRRIAVGADHGGYALKVEVVEWLRELGYVVLDLGTRDESPVDYPDFARAVAEAVARGNADLGICVDGAGIGSAIAANKVPGVRAAACHDVATARNAREHNFANVLTLGGRMLARQRAHEIVRAFLATAAGGERHAKRVEKITAIERAYARRPQAERASGEPR